MTIGISKIMIGIDGSEESVNAAGYAIAIAKRHNAELIAVNVLTSDIGYAYSSPGVESPPLTIREIILLAEDEVKKWLDDIKEKADKSGIQFRSEIIMAKRSAVSTMLDYAEEQKIDLIVVGTRGEDVAWKHRFRTSNLCSLSCSSRKMTHFEKKSCILPAVKVYLFILSISNKSRTLKRLLFYYQPKTFCGFGSRFV